MIAPRAGTPPSPGPGAAAARLEVKSPISFYNWLTKPKGGEEEDWLMKSFRVFLALGSCNWLITGAAASEVESRDSAWGNSA